MSRYQSSLGKYRAGDEIVVDAEAGELLLRDSPGSFSFSAPRGEKKAAGKAPVFDLEGASLDELTAYAAAEGIAIEDGASEDDVRAAIALELEARAKAKLETEHTAGATTTVRPQRKARTR